MTVKRPHAVQKREDRPQLPMVLLVHGGPWARDVWGFHPYVAWLTNRGYAVLQVNFRCVVCLPHAVRRVTRDV